MNCPRCQCPLEDPQARFCPDCGASIPVPQAPIPTSVVDPGPSGSLPGLESPAPADPASAHCALHPDRAAVDICGRCGTFACRDCLIVGADGTGVCSACYERQGTTGPLPWEQRSDLGLFKAYWETCKLLMFSPNTAFERVEPETGKWWDPLSFSILSTFVASSGILVFYALIGGVAGIAAYFGASSHSSSASSSAPSAAIIIGVILAIIAMIAVMVPLGAITTAFLMGGMNHLALKLVGVQTRGFEATVRAYCYGQAPMFWGVVPVCGVYAYPIWQIVCQIYGFKALHKTSGGKATAGALLPLVLCCGLYGAFYAVLFAVGAMGKH